jgi:hypothetical protein
MSKLQLSPSRYDVAHASHPKTRFTFCSIGRSFPRSNRGTVSCRWRFVVSDVRWRFVVSDIQAWLRRSGGESRLAVIGDGSRPDRFFCTTSHLDEPLDEVLAMANAWEADKGGAVDQIRL